ncbi:LRR and NB-ARC domain disease resistance protein, partial [Trifolium pratense]
MASVAVESVVAVFTKFLIEEYAVLAEAGKHVEWIEKELRSMQGLLEQVEQRGDGEQEQALKEWADKLKDVALKAEDVIKTFVIKSVKRRRWGVLHWYDKYKVGKELEKIRKSMRDICQNGMNLNTHVVTVSVETPPPSSSSFNYTATIVAAMKKLDHILSSQDLITGNNKVIKIVEEVKDGLNDLQNIVSKLNSTNERETVWLEEVNDVCSYMAEVVGNFIAGREKWLQMRSSLSLVRKVLYHDASLGEFNKQMKHVSTQIGDALGRSLTYGVVRDVNLTITQRSTTIPFQNSVVENSIISEFIIFSISYPVEYLLLAYGSNSTSWAVVILIVVISQTNVFAAKREPIRARKLKTNPKRGAISRLLTSSIFIFTAIDSVIFVLSRFISLQLAVLFQLIYPLYLVIVWIVKLSRSMDNNLKCVQRDLDLMHAFLTDTIATESEQGMMNERQKVWVGQLRVMAQNGRSLLNAVAKGCWSRRTKFARDINCLLEEIINISHRKNTYDIADIIIQGTTQQELICSEEHPEPAASSSSYRPVTGLKQEVQLIRREQELMYALFRDVLDMREIDRRYRIWVEQMQGIANDIGSVIYQYDAKLKHRSILIYIFKYWTRHVISHKINAIKNKIEDASRRRRAYGLGKTIESSASTVHILRGTTQLSLVAKESDVVGFDDDAQVLMAQLLSDERRRCITWIVGIGGTGKTTLAKKIFLDKTV